MSKKTIYLDDAIDAIKALWDGAQTAQHVSAMFDCEDAIRALPSAQSEKPFKLPKIYVADGYDTIAGEDGNVGFGVYVPDENQVYVAGDVDGEIRERALFHEICHWVQAMCGRPFDEDEANEFSNLVYDALPSAQPEILARGEGELIAQPEIIRCKDCKYCEHWYADRGRCFLWAETGISVFEDGYCNYAERRKDG